MKHRQLYQVIRHHCEWDVFYVCCDRTEETIARYVLNLLELSVRLRTLNRVGRQKISIDTAQLSDLLFQIVDLDCPT